MFRYLSLSNLCDITFTWFLLSWFLTRHVLFNIVIWSVYYDAPRLIPFAWDPERGQFLSKGSHAAFLSSLVALQVSRLPFSLVIILYHAGFTDILEKDAPNSMVWNDLPCRLASH
jgi:hypothetical protein